ncbi:MAG TPA: glycosyltransferase family 87 protein, partial [Bacteroidia bacterium]|nr:glycosyltransferase family 87 protein [Bacteroidia bacterium]
MTKKQYNFINGLFVLLGVVLLFEVIRDSVADGDFIGYLNAGNLVLAKKDIYSDYYNTWPPFFSVFSVILALIDKCSPVLVRVLWLTGSLVALFYIIKITSKMFLDKVPGFKNGASIRFQDPIIFVPVLIMVRFLLDNLDNVQINIYMLLLSCLTIYFFTQNKYLLSGLILALGISLKAYPIFILFYFIYKREMRVVLWTGIFLVLVNSITILVFGADQAFAY